MKKTINVYRNGDVIVNDAFENAVLKFNLKKERDGHQSFVLCGSEPGVGTTSTVIELAIALSVAGCKTVILDVNLRKDSGFKRLNDNVGSGFADYIRGSAKLEDIVYQSNWENLNYIPSGIIDGKQSLQLLYSAEINTLMQNLKKKFDFILIDTPSISTSLDAVFFSLKADAVVLVAAIDGSKKKYLEYAKNQLKSSGANLIGVIENKVGIKEYRQYIKDYDYFENGRFIRKDLKAAARKEISE